MLFFLLICYIVGVYYCLSWEVRGEGVVLGNGTDAGLGGFNLFSLSTYVMYICALTSNENRFSQQLLDISD